MTEDLRDYFHGAFDVVVLSIDVQSHYGVLGTSAINGLAYTQNTLPYFEVTIRCCLAHSLPSGVSLFEWFDMRDCGHALHFMRTSNDVHHGEIQLNYRTADINKFTLDVKNSDYRRYSEKFHQQLEEILNDGTEEG